MTDDEGVLVGEDGRARCAWAGHDQEYRRYHDEEWGVPLHGDPPLLEKICLEGFQSGLSWLTILRKRPRFREVFHDFDLESVAALGDDDVDRLMADTGIIRNRAKIVATIENAQATVALRDRHGDGALDRLVWSIPDDRSGGRPATREQVPTRTAASLALSRALRSAGFRFVGPTTMYALQQSAGIVDDHLAGCFRAVE
ncbi:DNA-3-methyladenine glycosylase I [Rathayibacter sp. VKM Ac-2630]|uniref:DNA-3-methyladenine glycosylase I n=1 Tax=Rathayibacter sp. VKM Ac-2630 TaxID=1938617 RepID=UPI0009820995|nr:DNA-3-methyladenine glycosylase I [Rathayibacter sp. VKM Ac-2630]OOB90354.1 3-methyladenine DNA glycosylase [Rathayibacter sp. VKM Ac-2630]